MPKHCIGKLAIMCNITGVTIGRKFTQYIDLSGFVRICQDCNLNLEVLVSIQGARMVWDRFMSYLFPNFNNFNGAALSCLILIFFCAFLLVEYQRRRRGECVYYSALGRSGLEPDREALKAAGGRLNKKDGLTRYGDSHVKDKTS